MPGAGRKSQVLQGLREVFEVKAKRSVVASAEYYLFHVASKMLVINTPAKTLANTDNYEHVPAAIAVLQKTCSLQYDDTNTAQVGRRDRYAYSNC